MGKIDLLFFSPTSSKRGTSSLEAYFTPCSRELWKKKNTCSRPKRFPNAVLLRKSTVLIETLQMRSTMTQNDIVVRSTNN